CARTRGVLILFFDSW
nr:immunoglobulin heavy chain junction region [Macaca mulatta]MOW19238.1 immunoglobulin heavy chain junction region [Macaca mulatta]MOW19452.1 immunoglobulin heavy chain junction region [Macaca mulatta]MOW19576.1 immunoglobulin heavy chain junction region [Macaca mulatta]MOW20341.1 immunoglobulin heavy chain junction region [Macaca mulatta]